MSDLLVRDYLQTQGLKLSADDVRVAYLAAEAVVNMGQAEIDRSVLWNGEAAALLPRNGDTEAVLRQVFMALDSVYSRSDVRSAAVYALLPQQVLLCLSAQGRPVAEVLSLDAETERRHLACRSAGSGWLNLAGDVPRWLENGDLAGAEHADSGSQAALPVCSPSGRVLGVVYVESAEKNAFGEDVLAQWVALALALAAPLRVLAGDAGEAEDE
ncbi:Uncharacterised protein [Kingella potus]|uniref:GAF domain-containing protein n=1 Tax=Kingella potus TaxID=265175 RepID=A0A377R5H3_9NEIS|nr:GAF domain-containing protein [Kingella potus]UOP00144.1 GAF domain-containing protein [Kingella potus]STR02795.1 Uncharacterised protein [Kingella potus]